MPAQTYRREDRVEAALLTSLELDVRRYLADVNKVWLFVKSYGENFLKNFMQFWISELGGLCCLAGI